MWVFFLSVKIEYLREGTLGVAKFLVSLKQTLIREFEKHQDDGQEIGEGKGVGIRNGK